jgi:hypothetical protein
MNRAKCSRSATVGFGDVGDALLSDIFSVRLEVRLDGPRLSYVDSSHVMKVLDSAL